MIFPLGMVGSFLRGREIQLNFVCILSVVWKVMDVEKYQARRGGKGGLSGDRRKY